MNELKVFSNDEFGEIRTSCKENEIWFCLADVCRVLELSQPSKVKDRLNLNGVNTIPTIDIMGRKQKALFINESNLYKTIFQSRKDNAEKFTDWVTSEVLPSIRKTGKYEVKSQLPTDYISALEALLESEKEKQLQRLQLEQQKPLVEFAETVSNAVNSISIGDFAKILHGENIKLGRNKMFDWFRDNKYLMKGNIPYQKYIDCGYFEVIEQSYKTPYGDNVTTKTLLTGKGQIYFVETLRKKYSK